MDRATVDQLLTTTRTVRKRLDLSRPVEPTVIQECLELAIQAPNGGNQNRYHFVVVTDPVKRAAIGAIYKKVYYQEHTPLSGAGDPGLPVYPGSCPDVLGRLGTAALGPNCAASA